MSIYERLQRIAKANLNWLLDKAESPEQMLTEKIRELEQAIQDAKEAAASYGSTYKRMQRQMEDLQRQQQQWLDRAKQAIDAGDDDQARKALGEKVKLGERIAQIEPGVRQGEQTYEKLRSAMLELMDQLQSARMKLSELKARKQAAEAQTAFGRKADTIHDATRGDETFEKFEDEVMHKEAVADIEAQIRADTIGEELDLEGRARELQVEAQLQELREQMGKADQG